jgi:AcrR family transcriptional regulator
MRDKLTSKGESTRQHLVETSISLFKERGYEATSMRSIAKHAGVSPGLAYRYFDGKESLVAELYAQLSTEFVQNAVLPEGSWTERGLAALDGSLSVLKPHRDVLATLMGSSATQRSLSPPMARTAPAVEAVFFRAIAESKPPPRDARAVGEILYLAHLGVLLFWILDRSVDQRATSALRDWVGNTLPMLALALRIPGAMRPIRSLLNIVKLGVLGRQETEA